MNFVLIAAALVIGQADNSSQAPRHRQWLQGKFADGSIRPVWGWMENGYINFNENEQPRVAHLAGEIGSDGVFNAGVNVPAMEHDGVGSVRASDPESERIASEIASRCDPVPEDPYRDLKRLFLIHELRPYLVPILSAVIVVVALLISKRSEQT